MWTGVSERSRDRNRLGPLWTGMTVSSRGRNRLGPLWTGVTVREVGVGFCGEVSGFRW